MARVTIPAVAADQARRASWATAVKGNDEDHETRIVSLEGIAVPSLAQILKATVTLTNAQIKALPTTGITLVAAPSAAKRVAFASIDVAVNATAGAYTNIDAAGYLVAMLGGDEVSNFAPNDAGETLTHLTVLLSSGTRVYGTLTPWMANSANWGPLPSIWDADGQTNAALTIKIDNGSSGDLTGGNAANTATVTTYYSVVTVV